MYECMVCSTLTASVANPSIFRPGQLVEMSVNIRALCWTANQHLLFLYVYASIVCTIVLAS